MDTEILSNGDTLEIDGSLFRIKRGDALVIFECNLETASEIFGFLWDVLDIHLETTPYDPNNPPEEGQLDEYEPLGPPGVN